MIYILNRNKMKFNYFKDMVDRPFQYVNLEYVITDFLFKDQPTKVHHIHNDEERIDVETVEKILQENPDIKIFACDFDCFTYKAKLINYDEDLCKRYPNIFFIFFYDELDFTLLLNSRTAELQNAAYIINSFNTSDAKQLRNKVFPYYMVNLYLQKNMGMIESMHRMHNKMRRYKKYNFFTGVHKPFRFLAYQLLNKHNLLNDGFVSYLDFTGYLKQPEKIQETAEWLNISVEELERELSTLEIPYLLETYDGHYKPGLFETPFIIPPTYAMQSYISINSETNYMENTNLVSLSEKSFKAFAAYNIPLIFGQPSLVEYLRSLGFDMFDDLFDNTPVNNRSELHSSLDKNLGIIKNMSYRELHEFYFSNAPRLLKNYHVLMSTLKSSNYEIINRNAKAILGN